MIEDSFRNRHIQLELLEEEEVLPVVVSVAVVEHSELVAVAVVVVEGGSVVVERLDER